MEREREGGREGGREGERERERERCSQFPCTNKQKKQIQESFLI